jgi:signal transduction histidine kinase
MNACLAGFFAFAAIHYAINWWSSRNEHVLLVFSIQCVAYTLYCLTILSLFRATTIPQAQIALDRLVTLGVLAYAVVLQFYACVGERRDRLFRTLVTSALAFFGLLNQRAPLRGVVLELRTMRLPGGATGLLPIRTSPGLSLALLYGVALAVQGYGLFIARAIWKRDRAGAVLVAIAAAASLAGAAVGFLIDFAKVRAPYVGAWPHAIFVFCVALFISREYSARGTRATASERRLDRSLRETQDALTSWQEEQRRREESEAARQKAQEALVQAQRMEIASQLAAGVAHDFNNVLHVISMSSSVLLVDAAPAEKERARRALDNAQQQGQALSRQLMALARPEARSVTRFPLDHPIKRTIATLKPALPRNIQLHFGAPAAAEIEADETEIQQVIFNLVLNARDAMPSGGPIQVTADVQTSPIPIGVVGGTLAAGRWATLSVTDSGPGIDPAIREKIFDLFFTTKGPERGTGLGLATVLRIAKISGGGVAVETEAGCGTTFRIYLPAV